jgi:hypothetical protein
MLMNVVSGSCNGACGTSSDGPRELTGIKVEQDTDMDVKVGEVPEPLPFPALKSEQAEVSYVSVCHGYTELQMGFSLLHVFVYLNISRGVYGRCYLFLGYVNPYDGTVSANQIRDVNTCLSLTTRI